MPDYKRLKKLHAVADIYIEALKVVDLAPNGTAGGGARDTGAKRMLRALLLAGERTIPRGAALAAAYHRATCRAAALLVELTTALRISTPAPLVATSRRARQPQADLSPVRTIDLHVKRRRRPRCHARAPEPAKYPESGLADGLRLRCHLHRTRIKCLTVADDFTQETVGILVEHGVS